MSKTIYVEQILHNFQLAGIGNAFTSKKKAINFLREIKAERDSVNGYSEDELWIVYEINNTVVQINFQETELL